MAKKEGKRGQATIYIALALIVIALAAVIFYIQQSTTTQELESQVKRITIQPEAQDMQDFITNCLDKTTSDAIKIAAAHGGWIKPAGRINRANPTEGEAVTLSPTSDQAIPYWNYLSTPNNCEGNCKFSGLQPPLKKPATDSIEEQIDSYVANNLRACLDGFQKQKQEGYTIIEEGPLTISTTITDQNVATYASYPLRYDRAGESLRTNEVFTTIPVRLGMIYKLADEITKTQTEYRFLEKQLKILIDLQSGTSTEQIPPIYEVQFQMGTGTTWTKSQVKKRITDLLSTYTPFLQVFGTANYRKIIPPRTNTDQRRFDTIYNRNMLVITNTDHGYPDLEARFSYLPWWEPYFDLNCQGELCRAESLINTLGVPYGIQRYLFSYDTSYPVMVELRDPDAFRGVGLTFTYMLESNMRNNEPMTGQFDPIKMDIGSGANMFCDPGQLNGRRLNMTIIDGRDGRTVEGAELIYSCGPTNDENSSSCDIKASDKSGLIYSKLPVCVGGTLMIIKDGYTTRYIPFDSDIKDTTTIKTTLEPIRLIDIEVERRRLIKTPQGWTLETDPIALDPNEEASISMHRIGTAWDEEQIAVAQQLGDTYQDAQSNLHTGVPITPGKYQVDISTILSPDPAITIPADRRCYSGQCVDAPKDPITFDTTHPMPLGGASYTVEIKKEDLDNAKTLRLYAIDVSIDMIPETDRKIEDLEQIADIDKMSMTYSNEIMPAWK